MTDRERDATDPEEDATGREPDATDGRLTYDDLAAGDRFVADRTVSFSRESIVEFARKYDPQPFHVGDDAPAASPFDGLVASGLHSFCACNRLATEAFFGRVAFLGGRGVDDLRWHRPVLPGDALSVDVVVADKRASASDPRRGYVDVDVTGRIVETDEDGAAGGKPSADADPVVTWRVLGMIERDDEEGVWSG